MQQNLIVSTPSAYSYPLLVKQLLIHSLSLYGDQEISYRGEMRYSYRDFRRRVGQLASTLSSLGAKHGSTVAVMDWDSHRYLECYFGVPMMGATLFTVNVRLSPQQILYTLNDADADIVLVHPDFVPVLEQIHGQLTCNPRFVLLADGQPAPQTDLPFVGEYEALLAAASPDFDFPEFDENTKAATFYTTGTTGDPKGVCYSHRDIVLHTLATSTSLCSPREGQRMHREDVYMPITPMFHVLAWGIPYVAVMLGLRTVLPGRYAPDMLLSCARRRRSRSRIACRPSCRCCCSPRRTARRISPAGKSSSAVPRCHRHCARQRSTAASTSLPDTACRRPARSFRWRSCLQA